MRDVTSTATELTKAAIRFSWSLPLFGAQQFVNLLKPAKAASAFDSASSGLQQELGDLLYSAYATGDRIQTRIVDAALGRLGGNGNHETGTDSTGWGPMPYPVIVPPDPAAVGTGSDAISAEYPFEPNYLEVLGSKMHYIDVGSGDPILILHGNPTWSYIWRNIIPHLQPLGRCIAPDLIGYGRSDKPNIEYRWANHVRYLDKFIEKMNLKNVTLVLHDQGSGLGFHYAMRHEQNIKGMAFFEAILRPYPWESFSTPEFRDIFRRFRSGGVGGEGWQMLVEQNVFIEQLLPQAAGRPLSQREMNYYREPFTQVESRLPIWRFPRETPIGGEPADVWQAVSNYSNWLQRTSLRKLLLYAEPGALVTAEHLEWARQRIPNLTTAYVGPGAHFLQESSPHQIGREVAQWISSL